MWYTRGAGGGGEGGRLPEPADQKTQEAASGDDTNSSG
jgi:hypothetical protein